MQFAQQHGITVNIWPLQGTLPNFHIGVLVSFGYLIPKEIIDSFPLGMLNVHGSLLPRWRGAAPMVYTLMNGDEQAGVTIMKIKPKKFDIGDIVMQEALSIGPNETFPELYTKLAKLGADTLVRTLNQMPDILSAAKPQSGANVTYARRISKKTASIRWNDMTSKDIYNLHRALLGIYSLTTKFQERKAKLLNIEKVENPSEEIRARHGPPGTAVFDNNRKALIVKCKGETWIAVKNLVIEGHRPITASEFNCGYIANKKKKEIFFCTE
ncbi:hypothetical protein KM043_010596 [Ampulex compressa]|nr:hypothetical protein KM043_010596 [Ampulex compressa]